MAVDNIDSFLLHNAAVRENISKISADVLPGFSFLFSAQDSAQYAVTSLTGVRRNTP
jgi:hypothetical protein